MLAKPFTTTEIREAFLAFFADKGCVRYSSAPLVPENDPTTLFTVAGMSQFKDMFLGRGTHPFTRATTAQKCLRTNDILNVGRTTRHQTFFEMLGNFSFNDYFKKEAIHWAWEFLTKVLALDGNRLSVSVHRIDDEAYRIWYEEIGLPATRIFRLGDADNFWPADAPTQGPEGPGGFCSEIFWDFRTNADPADNLTSSTGRFVEVWNLVFPQFNVRKPNVDGSPNLEQLGRNNIDTGMGLERISCVVQGVTNNFDIDMLQTIVKRVVVVSNQPYDTTVRSGPQAERNVLLRRIADHVRAVTFCVTDGALPANTGRGYIVRRLIRRATLDIDKLGVKDARLHEIVDAVVLAMSDAYPDLLKRQQLVRETLMAEEAAFRRTLSRGLELLTRALERQTGTSYFSGDDAFELVTTHGFPKETIEELVAEKGLKVDDVRFQERWNQHTEVSHSRQVEVFSSSALQEAKPRLGPTPFDGYDHLEETAELTLLEKSGREVHQAESGSEVRFALSRTPFYAESGGQVGDTGTVRGVGFTITVTDVQKDEGLVIHSGVVSEGTAKPGPVTATIDGDRRHDITSHHSATHLLHAALGRFVGDHVEQQGSKVEAAALRFDFNNPRGLTNEQLAQVEQWVNQQIAIGHVVDIRQMPVDAARHLGAKAQFGEKYGQQVRVITMGPETPVSRELCGGCHVDNTKTIRAFRIVKEEASAAGIRRITAVAGRAAVALVAHEAEIAQQVAELMGVRAVDDAKAVEQLAQSLKVPRKDLPGRLQQMQKEMHELAGKLQATLITASGGVIERFDHLQAELKRLRRMQENRQAQAAAGQADRLLEDIETVDGVPLLVAQLDGIDAKSLSQLAENLRGKRPSLCVVLGSSSAGKAVFVSAVSKDLVERGLSAGEMVKRIAESIGGRGGGRPDQAQAGAADGGRVAEALATVTPVVQQLTRP